MRGGLYKEAALLQICSNGHSTIVHECNRCPLCALTEHNNAVHDFIESKGRGLVSELVAYQHRKAAGQGERPANVTQHTHAGYAQIAAEMSEVAECWHGIGHVGIATRVREWARQLLHG